MKKAARIVAIVYLVIGIICLVTFLSVGAGLLGTARLVAEQYIQRNPGVTQDKVDAVYYSQLAAGIAMLLSSLAFVGMIVVSCITRKIVKPEERTNRGTMIALGVINLIFSCTGVGVLCLIDGIVNGSEDNIID